MATKHKRHTCQLCGKKRVEPLMEITDINFFNNKPEWCCIENCEVSFVPGKNLVSFAPGQHDLPIDYPLTLNAPKVDGIKCYIGGKAVYRS